MIFSYFKILLILLVITITKSNVAPYSFTCSPALPHLSVGDYNLTESNHEKTLAKHNIVAIVITATWFKGSCMYEPFWKDLKENVLEKNDVKMARIDFNSNRWISEYVKIERIPMLVFVKNKAYYPYNSLLDTVRIQNYLDKMEKPVNLEIFYCKKFLELVVSLATLEEVEDFFSLKKYDSRGAFIHSVKVVGIFYNLEEMEEELKEFRKTAEQSLDRPEVYFATLLIPAEIKKAKQKYQDDWFEDYSLSTIVIQKVEGIYTKIELSEIYSRSLLETIRLKTFPLVQEYNLQNHYEYEKTKLPMLVGVVDSANDPNHFRDFILTLEKVAANYTDKAHITWVDGVFNKNKKKMLGIEHDNLPTLAFNLILDPKNNTLSYPQEWPITEEKISQFVSDYITYSLYDLRIIYGMDKKVEKSNIYNLFTHVREYGSNNLTSVFSSKRKKSDLVLIIFDSQNHKNIHATARSFNHIAKRFHDLQIRKIEFGVYDTFYFDLPDNFRSLKVPCFAMLTINQKQKPFYIPLDTDIPNLMNIIQERASFEFHLPPYPYIPEEQLARFYMEMVEKGSTPDIKSYIS